MREIDKFKAWRLAHERRASDVEQLRDALARAHAALDREHAHTNETWRDREVFLAPFGKP